MNQPWSCGLIKLMVLPTILVAAIVLLITSSCLATPHSSSNKSAETGVKMNIRSSAFQNGQVIPKQFTGDGKNVSPPLSWDGHPAKTQTFALICDDPDAPMGTWVHWVIYNVPATAQGLGEGVPTQETLSDGASQGKNSFDKTGYGGPAPPPGKPHRYYFKLYALDTKLNCKPGAKKDSLLESMKNHILAESQLMGIYHR